MPLCIAYLMTKMPMQICGCYSGIIHTRIYLMRFNSTEGMGWSIFQIDANLVALR